MWCDLSDSTAQCGVILSDSSTAQCGVILSDSSTAQCGVICQTVLHSVV